MYSSWYFCKLVFSSPRNAKHRARGRLQRGAWMNRLGQEIWVESGQFHPPRSQSASARPRSSSSSVPFGFCLCHPSNRRLFQLILLSFFHLPALLLRSPSASLSSTSGVSLGEKPGCQEPSFGSWLCAHMALIHTELDSHLCTTANQLL